ncbi:MAG: M24 family metallopeptidase, partial [Spirochaetota bacterium]
SSLRVRTRTFNMEAEQRYLLAGDSAARLSAMDSPTAGGEGLTRAYPSGAGMKRVQKGEPFLIDSVFIHEGYVVDCTRIYAPGKLDSRLERAHGVSADCHRMFQETAARGEEIAALHRRVCAHVEEQGLSRWFMGGVKFIGHGVGLELDELPVLTARSPGVLQEGMAVAFEPKFVFPEGTVGYENTYAIQGGRAVSLNRMDEAIQYL